MGVNCHVRERKEEYRFSVLIPNGKGHLGPRFDVMNVCIYDIVVVVVVVVLDISLKMFQ
jgi:hypothetical protein